jgi:ABC-type Mn2+/Zn2+ transport system ATPase subunit
MVSHDLELVNSFADQVLTLKPEALGAGRTRTVVEMNGGTA